MLGTINVRLRDFLGYNNQLETLIDDYENEMKSYKTGFDVDKETGDFADSIIEFDGRMSEIENMMIALAKSTKTVLAAAEKQYFETDNKMANDLNIINEISDIFD